MDNYRYQKNGTSVLQSDTLYPGNTFIFEKCKVKKERCKGKKPVTILGRSFSFPFEYIISEKGKKIIFYFTDPNTNTETVQDATILEHSKRKFVYKFLDDNDEYEVTMEK